MWSRNGNDLLRTSRDGSAAKMFVKTIGIRVKNNTFASELHALNNAMEMLIDAGAKKQELQMPIPAIHDHLKRNYLPGSAAAIERLRRKAAIEDRRLREVIENGLKPSEPITDIQALMMDMKLQGKKQSEIIQLALQHDKIGAYVLADEVNYRLYGFSDAARPELLNSLFRANTARRFQRTQAATANISDVLGRTVRTDEAEELTKAAIAELDAARSDVDAMAAHVSNAIDFASVAVDDHPSTVWSLMTKVAA